MRAKLPLAVACTATAVAAGWFGLAGPKPPRPAAVGWREVFTDGRLTVFGTDTRPAAYLLAAGRSGVLIDAPFGPAALGPNPPAAVETVLLTHHHRDSCAGAADWAAAGVRVRAAKASTEWLTPAAVKKFWAESVPLRNSRTAYFVLPAGVERIDATLAAGDTVAVGDWTVTAHPTPGHSRDHLAFVATRPGGAGPLVFCGDAVTGHGKLWTPFTTDWDHWTDAGLKPAAESLRGLAKLKPAALFPARGPAVTADAAGLLDKAAATVEEVGFLKSFERFTDRLGDPPDYPFLVPKEQIASDGSKPWCKVSDHLWITGNTYVLASPGKEACLVLDPWAMRSVEQVEALRAAEKLGPVERVLFSHAHYDHYDGVYDLPGRDGYQVWGLDLVADPLRLPLRLRAPFLDERPIRFDRVFRDGEAADWRGYTLRFHALPGQTAFTCGIETAIDGKRCYFTADNFFHQRQFSGSGGWMGLNRSSPAVYGESAKKVLAAAPEWVLAEHGGPYVFNTEDFRRRVRWGEAAAAAADAVCPSGRHRDDWNPHRVAAEPALQRAKPGDAVAAVLRFANAGPAAATVSVTVRGRGLFPDQMVELTADAGRESGRRIDFRLPADLPPGRHVFAVSPSDSSGDFADPFLTIDVSP